MLLRKPLSACSLPLNVFRMNLNVARHKSSAQAAVNKKSATAGGDTFDLEESIDESFTEALKAWKTKTLHTTAQLKLIQAEISLLKSSNDCDMTKLRDLEQQERELKMIMKDSVSNNSATREGSKEVKLPLFRDMNNAEFRLNYGPDLIYEACKYFHVFQDLGGFPSEGSVKPLKDVWNAKSVVNFVVDYRKQTSSAQRTEEKGTFPLKWEDRRQFMKENNEMIVNRGNIMDIEIVMSEPQLKFHCDQADTGKLFSAFMVDLDVPIPSKKTMLPIIQSIRANITSDSKAGESFLSYVPPHPCRGTGFHRYAWVLCSHETALKKEVVLDALKKAEFDFSKFVNVQGLQSIELRGLNFFRSAWSEKVSELFTGGLVKEPACYSEGVADEEGRVMIKSEPVYGKTIDRDWETVTRRLYKYAYQ